MVRYVVIPRDLASDLHEPLRRHFARDQTVRVIVERRDRADAAPPPAVAGRRAGDPGPERRLTISSAAPAALPPEAIPHANRLRFLRLIEPDAPDVADRDSLRLVARFQHGDPDAFDALYRRHYESVYGYLRMSLRDPHQAEDVAQLVFLRALRALPRYRFRPGVPFWSWLREIAANEARRALRGRGVVVDSQDPVELERTGDVREAWRGERALVELGEQLPERQQHVFILRYGIGLSIAETASALSITEDAVKSLSKRALARVRAELRPPPSPPTADPPAQRLPMLRRLYGSPVLAGRNGSGSGLRLA